MKNLEKIIKALEICTLRADDACEDCPYHDNCNDMDNDVLKLIKEMKAVLEKPTASCDYELTFKAYDEDIRKLNDQLCCVTMERDRACADLAEAQRELTSLRAVKATAEAFLGVKIDGYIN